MGLYDFWWNSIQEGKLTELTEENEKLRAEIDQLTTSLNAWINYFNEKIKELEKK